MKNILHSFYVVTQGEGKPGDLTFKRLFSTRDENEVQELSGILLERNAGFRRVAMTRNSREVVVLHVDQKEHEGWVSKVGRNGLASKPLRRGQVFNSATEASGHVGLRHNEVAMMLSRCAATGENKATVRGVTFAYKDTVK